MDKVLLKDVNWFVTGDNHLIPFLVNKQCTSIKLLPSGEIIIVGSHQIVEEFFRSARNCLYRMKKINSTKVILNEKWRAQLNYRNRTYMCSISSFDLYLQYFAATDFWIPENIERELYSKKNDKTRLYDPSCIFPSNEANLYIPCRLSSLRSNPEKNDGISYSSYKEGIENFEKIEVSQRQLERFTRVITRNYLKVQNIAERKFEKYRKEQNKQKQEKIKTEALSEESQNF